MTKYIFVTGGVVSGLGKGITAASLGRLLKMRGLKVAAQKLDPYINVDPGTMSPYQHGEVYVTEDGAETDLDLGHYERFIDEDLNKYSNLTTGKVYWNVLNKERRGEYLGSTVQVIPHITNEIKDFVYRVGKKTNADVVITDVWTSMGQEEERAAREAAFKGYCVDGGLMAQAKPDAMVQHCLPAHRGEEITAEVFEANAQYIFEEAENRLHAQKAVMVKTMGASTEKE